MLSSFGKVSLSKNDNINFCLPGGLGGGSPPGKPRKVRKVYVYVAFSVLIVVVVAIVLVLVIVVATVLVIVVVAISRRRNRSRSRSLVGHVLGSAPPQ